MLAAVSWALLTVVQTEILSWGKYLTFYNVSWFWAVAVLGLFGCCWKRAAKPFIPRVFLPQFDPLEWLMLSVILGAAGLSALTAWMAPPNNWDSLVYHMSRVEHWVQNHTVAHYPTAIKKQIYFAPGAEFLILQFQILSGTDRWANLVQWFAMAGSAVAVSLIGQRLGLNRRYQIFAAMVSVTIPMGLLQAATTQNDYVTAFWLACFVYFILEHRGQATVVSTIAMSASLALAVFTKPTAYIYALSFVIWFLLMISKKKSSVILHCLFILALAVVLVNGGHYWRNGQAAGHVFGEAHVFENTQTEGMNAGFWLSNVMRNIGLHLGTSILELNAIMNSVIYKIHAILNIDIADPRSTFGSYTFKIPLSLHEDGAGNLTHLALVVFTLAVLGRKKTRDPLRRGYLIALLAAAVLFTWLLKWQPSGSRLHLPGFVLWAPLVSVGLSELSRRKAVVLLAVSLFLTATATPYIFRNSLRKLYSGKKSTVFNTPRIQQYFANDRDFYLPYQAAVDHITAAGCADIGLAIGSNGWESPFWVMLREKYGTSFRLEHVGGSVSDRAEYPLGRFSPCAVIALERSDEFLNLGETGLLNKSWESAPVSVYQPPAPR